MDKYIGFEDIRNALIELNNSGEWLERTTTMNIIKALVGLPSIDIVHCRECKWFDNKDYREPAGYCIWHESVVKNMDFCSNGERKEE